MSFVWLIFPETPLDRAVLGEGPFVYREGPRPGSVVLASQQEVGLFALSALPRYSE